MMVETLLPAEFQDLEEFAVDWALPTEPERRLKRQSTNMEAIGIFYDRMTSRIDDILGYLNAMDLDTMPRDALNLLHMILSLAEIGPAVEVYKQPEVTDGFPIERFRSRRVEN